MGEIKDKLIWSDFQLNVKLSDSVDPRYNDTEYARFIYSLQIQKYFTYKKSNPRFFVFIRQIFKNC